MRIAVKVRPSGVVISRGSSARLLVIVRSSILIFWVVIISAIYVLLKTLIFMDSVGARFVRSDTHLGWMLGFIETCGRTRGLRNLDAVARLYEQNMAKTTVMRISYTRLLLQFATSLTEYNTGL